MSDEKPALPDAITDALLAATSPVEPSRQAKERIRDNLLQRVRQANPEEALVTRPAGAEGWIEAAPGNHIKVLRSDQQTMSMLVRLDPGATFPAHSHPEDEETYVIEGETWFGDIRLRAGDYHLAPKGTEHGEVRTDTGCTLLIRKVAD
ncbi:MAG: cupin domain-containing protein [Halieaceae bacterium]|jgi:quercetin dioxygenase-like cupin family protein|nr:cupin domain-containing protein [Halieaceae bacterium]